MRHSAQVLAAAVGFLLVVGVFGGVPAGSQVGQAPSIDVWYGDVQPVGEHGRSQEWANILGNVVDPDGDVWDVNMQPSSLGYTGMSDGHVLFQRYHSNHYRGFQPHVER